MVLNSSRRPRSGVASGHAHRNFCLFRKNHLLGNLPQRQEGGQRGVRSGPAEPLPQGHYFSRPCPAGPGSGKGARAARAPREQQPPCKARETLVALNAQTSPWGKHPPPALRSSLSFFLV